MDRDEKDLTAEERIEDPGLRACVERALDAREAQGLARYRLSPVVEAEVGRILTRRLR